MTAFASLQHLLIAFDRLWQLFQLLTAFDSFWQIMIAYNLFSQLTTSFDSLQYILTAHNIFWRLLTAFDTLWHRLTAYDSKWQLLTATWLSSSQPLTPFDTFWHLLTPFDSLWQLMTAFDSYLAEQLTRTSQCLFSRNTLYQPRIAFVPLAMVTVLRTTDLLLEKWVQDISDSAEELSGPG